MHEVLNQVTVPSGRHAHCISCNALIHVLRNRGCMLSGVMVICLDEFNAEKLKSSESGQAE